MNNENYEMVKVSDLVPGVLNPRKSFPKEGMEELTESLRVNGFVPAVSRMLVRPLDGGKLEIVCGERRWRASKNLGLKEVPAVVKELTNAQVMRFHFLENVQREALNPLEEGIGFRQLVTEGHTIEQVAKAVGKGEDYVRKRLEICVLEGSEAGEALASGKMSASHAIEIARLPGDRLRGQATGFVLRNPYGPSPMPVQQFRDLCQDRFRRELRLATFDREDPDLVKVILDEQGNRIGGGRCNDCPCNSRNMPEPSRFPMCVNTECFEAKTAAGFERWREEELAAGRDPLTLDENVAVFDFNGATLAPHSRFVEVTGLPSQRDLKPGEESPGMWKKLIEGQGVPVKLARDESGAVHELVEREHAVDAAVRNGHDIFREVKKKKTQAEKQADNEAQKLAIERAAWVDGKELAAVIDGCREVRELNASLLKLVVQSQVAHLWDIGAAEPLAKSYGWEEKERADVYLLSYLDELATIEHKIGYLLGLMFFGRPLVPERRAAWAKALGVDLKVVRKKAEMEFAERVRAAVDAGSSVAGMHWLGERKTADEFEWSSANECEAPDVCRLDLREKETGGRAEIRVARSEKGWHVAVDAKREDESTASAWPSRMTTAYASRALATASGMKVLAKFFSGSSGELKKRISEFMAALGATKGARK
jgi:ParB/RepB/Spo0J family partition protein